jgi:hypothetical protein
MGLLSSLQRIVITPLAGTANLALSGLEKITGKKYGRQTVEAAMQDPVAKGLANVIIGGAAALGAVVAAPAAASAVAARGGAAVVAKTAAKALIPSTAKGKVIAAVAAPVVIGAISKEPVKVAKAAISAPSELAQFGGDVATFAANPSVENAKQIVKESPIISTVTGLLVAGGAVKTIAPAIATIKQTEAIKEQTEAIKGATDTIQAPSGITVTDLSKTQTPLTPITPQTAPMSSVDVAKTRRKRARKAKLPSVNQNVRVNVINSSKSVGISQTKKYLNKSILN